MLGASSATLSLGLKFPILLSALGCFMKTVVFLHFGQCFWSPSLPPHWSWSKPSQGLVKFFPRAAVQCRGLDGPGCHTVSAARRAQLSGQGWAQT